MNRKFACLFLAVSTTLSSVAVAFATPPVENDVYAQETAAYTEAVEALHDEGLHATAESTFENTMARPSEMGMLKGRRTLTLNELSAQALVAQEEQERAEAKKAEKKAKRDAMLAQYDGVKLHEGMTLRSRASSKSHKITTIESGKVAQLLDVKGDWYKVAFGGDTGYIRADGCRGVDYEDYRGTAATQTLLEQVLDEAYSYLGTPYVYGGASHSGTDCSGFTMAVFAKFGIHLSHGAQSQYGAGRHVSEAQRKAGDLVFFSGYGTSSIQHVGIYLGGGQFIHASTSSGVIISNIYDSYYGPHYYGACRVMD